MSDSSHLAAELAALHLQCHALDHAAAAFTLDEPQYDADIARTPAIDATIAAIADQCTAEADVALLAAVLGSLGPSADGRTVSPRFRAACVALLHRVTSFGHAAFLASLSANLYRAVSLLAPRTALSAVALKPALLEWLDTISAAPPGTAVSKVGVTNARKYVETLRSSASDTAGLSVSVPSTGQSDMVYPTDSHDAPLTRGRRRIGLPVLLQQSPTEPLLARANEVAIEKLRAQQKLEQLEDRLITSGIMRHDEWTRELSESIPISQREFVDRWIRDAATLSGDDDAFR